MIRANARWREFEAQYRRNAYRDLDFLEALSIFEAMWIHARKLNPNLGEELARGHQSYYCRRPGVEWPPAVISSGCWRTERQDANAST